MAAKDGLTMKMVVIAGSAKLQEEIKEWMRYWEKKNYVVLNYPRSIPQKVFKKTYPSVHKKFFIDLLKADVLFVANERKNNRAGYIGPETFAEIGFAVIQKILYKKKIEIILSNMPSAKVPCHDEITRWSGLKWIKIKHSDENL